MSAGTLSRRTMFGRTFTATARTWAHLEHTVAELKSSYPFAYMVVFQTCYHTGYAPSAGTHDKDGVLDVKIVGLGWWDAQLFLRRCGWAAWFRHTGEWSDESAWHIHMASIPEGLTNTPSLADVERAYSRAGIEVGVYVPAQIDDYCAHSLGLAGQHRAGADTSRFPRDIASTIFRYREDWFDMASKDDLKAAIREVLAEDGLVSAPADDAAFSDGSTSIVGALKRIWNLTPKGK